VAEFQVQDGKRWGWGGHNFRGGRIYHTNDPALLDAARYARWVTVTDTTISGPLTSGRSTADPEPTPEPEPADPTPPPLPEPAEDPAFTCETCGRTDFKSQASLTRHVNSNHKEDE